MGTAWQYNSDENSISYRYEKVINHITSVRPVPSFDGRVSKILQLNEQYKEEALGADLPSRLLCMLADWLMYEELSKKSKVGEEYAIHGYFRSYRRLKRESISTADTLDYFEQRINIRRDSLRKKNKKKKDSE